MDYKELKEEYDEEIKKFLRELPNEKIMEWLEFNWEEVSIEFRDKLVDFFRPEIAEYLNKMR